MELVLVRHPEPANESAGRCYGRLDVGLSPAGREQCVLLAARLSSDPVDAVVSSPLRRAREAADAIAAAHALRVSVVPELQELDFGELEGRAYEEIHSSHPELYERWMRAPTTVRFPDGESYEDLQARVADAVNSLREAHAGRTVVAVTHGGVIRAVLADALGMPHDRVFRLAVDVGSISRVTWLDGSPVVLSTNVPS